MARVTVEELEWSEEPLGEVAFPKQRLQLFAGLGSGLTSVPGSDGRLVWAIGDRGPNIKLDDAAEWYGWSVPDEWRDVEGAKLMPRPDIGPALALLEIRGGSVELKRTVRLKDRAGRPVSGLPVPDSGHAECEPVLDLDGRQVEPDAGGMDTEGLALLADGSFWAGEEYGPSLVRIGSDGEVLARLVPRGADLREAPYPVVPVLPALAARRHLNRGFEAVAVTPSNSRLYLVFQSPLAHPGEDEHKAARHVRVWQLDPSGEVAKQYLYRLDEPETFGRDNAKKPVEREDLKVCEIAALGEEELLVLERVSETSKIYRLPIDAAFSLPDEHLEIDTRPTLEELSRRGEPLPELSKELLFNSDDWAEVGPDMEGMALLDSRTLLIVSDNDFGCEGKQTRFYRLTFDTLLGR